MHCVHSQQTIDQVIKKSRFIGVITPCDTENQVLESLSRLHTEYTNASHIAFAFRVLTPGGTVMRFHDAGEPSGTAGKPIYQHIEGKELINTLIAVVRYFGGIKLGAGGLTRAYGNTARLAIDASDIQPYTQYCTLALKLEYPQLQLLEYQLKKLKGSIHDKAFSDHVQLTIKLPVSAVDQLTDLYPAAKIINA